MKLSLSTPTKADNEIPLKDARAVAVALLVDEVDHRTEPLALLALFCTVACQCQLIRGETDQRQMKGSVNLIQTYRRRGVEYIYDASI